MKASITIPNAFAHGHEGSLLDKSKAQLVADAAYNLAHEFPGGVPALAKRMEISAGTLGKKVNPGTTSHSLALTDAIYMEQASGDLAIMHAHAAAHGYVCVKAVGAASGEPLDLNWQLMASLADMQHAMADALRLGITRNSLQRCDVMAAEAVAAINNLVGAMRSRLPAPPEAIAATTRPTSPVVHERAAQQTSAHHANKRTPPASGSSPSSLHAGNSNPVRRVVSKAKSY